MNPGIYHDISNEDYHAGDGVSKSQLDMIAVDPSLLPWQKAAPVDTEKLQALDMGSALHCLILEPEEFDKRFVKEPKVDLRTTKGKAEMAEFKASIEGMNITSVPDEDWRKLALMHGSALAHPAARWLLEQAGHCESSHYWIDEETGELCRTRPDKQLTNFPILADVKKVSDMSRFARHIDEFRYHVQDAMYREGAKHTTGEEHRFVFIAVSESIDCGRYPVRVFELDAYDKDEGLRLFRRDLNTYHQCRASNEWGGVEIIKRPEWARKQDMYA